MSESQLSVFKRFNDLSEAQKLAEILKDKGFDVELADNSPALDITFSGNTLDNQIELKIPGADFRKAKDLLFSELDINLEEIDPDYYLLDFSNEELQDILLKCDEWGEYDVLLARKILASKGEDTSDGDCECARRAATNPYMRTRASHRAGSAVTKSRPAIQKAGMFSRSLRCMRRERST